MLRSFNSIADTGRFSLPWPALYLAVLPPCVDNCHAPVCACVRAHVLMRVSECIDIRHVFWCSRASALPACLPSCQTHGHGQAQAVASLIEEEALPGGEQAFRDVCIVEDYYGVERFVTAVRTL